jgi:preprotein translocase subunit SecD
MNRYPAWKYAIIVVALLIAALYTLPNFFGEAPAVQVSSAKSTVKVDSTTLAKVEQALKDAGIAADAITLEGSSIKARFGDTDTQLKAKDAIQKALAPDAN